MGIREVSQAEIWSKETSRKILSRVWKVLKWAGISIGTVVAALALFVFVWTHWLTAKERNAGTTALAQIDALQKSDGLTDTDFDAQVRQAQEKVDAATSAELTARDHEVAMGLWFYLDEIKFRRFRNKRMQEVEKLHPEWASPERKEQLKLQHEKFDSEELKTWRDFSHELLDKK